MKFKKPSMLKVFCLSILLLFMRGINSYAYSTFGGKWPSKYLTYAIYDDIPSVYVKHIEDAAYMWHHNTHIYLTPGNSSDINVMAYDYGKVDWDGISTIKGDPIFMALIHMAALN